MKNVYRPTLQALTGHNFEMGARGPFILGTCYSHQTAYDNTNVNADHVILTKSWSRQVESFVSVEHLW
jgi:hypothetical protein